MLVIAAAVLAIVLVPSAARATQPVMIPSSPGTFVIPAGAACDFDVQLAEGTNKEVTRIFSDGRVSVTGSYKVVLTNLETGAMLGVNASGSLHLTADGVIQESGPQIFLLFPGDVFGPGLYVFKGRVIPTRDENGATVSIEHHGFMSENLCGLLG